MADFHSKVSGTDRATRKGEMPVYVGASIKEAPEDMEDRETLMREASMTVYESGNWESVFSFVSHWIERGSTIKTDAGTEFVGIPLADYDHDKTVLGSGEKASEVLPWVHIVISNAKRFLNGTFHSVSYKRLQEYLNEFCYRLNRRHRESLFYDFMDWAIDPDIAHSARLTVRGT